MTALEVVKAAPGLDEYLADVEAELGHVVGRYPGLVAKVGASALAAGGKRLRPALAFLSSSPAGEPPLAAGVAVELVHMIEENVVSAAGTTHRTTTDELVHLIRAMGKTPVQRDTLYREVKVWN